MMEQPIRINLFINSHQSMKHIQGETLSNMKSIDISVKMNDISFDFLLIVYLHWIKINVEESIYNINH